MLTRLQRKPGPTDHSVPNINLMIPSHHLATGDLLRWTLVQSGMRAQLYVWADDLANVFYSPME